MDQVPHKGRGSDFFLLPPRVLVVHANRTQEKGTQSLDIASENTTNQQLTLSSIHRDILHSWHLGKQRNVPCMISRLRGIGKNFGIVGLEPRTTVSLQFFSKNRGGLA